MNQHLFVKTGQLIVAYRDVAVRRPGEGREQERKLCKLAHRLTKAGPMSEAILRLKRLLLVGLTCDWRLDLVRSGAPDFNFTSE